MKLKIVRPSINFYLCQLPIRGHSNITSAFFLATFRSVLLLCVIYCQIIRLRKRWPDTISYCELINSRPYRRGKHEVSGSTDPDFVDQEFKKSCETPHQSSFTVQFVNCASLHSGMHYRLATAASPAEPNWDLLRCEGTPLYGTPEGAQWPEGEWERKEKSSTPTFRNFGGLLNTELSGGKYNDAYILRATSDYMNDWILNI